MSELKWKVPTVELTTTPLKWPIHIVFKEVGALDPKDDITPKEAVQLTMMLACGSVGSCVDYASFVKEHRLERHFKADEVDE